MVNKITTKSRENENKTKQQHHEIDDDFVSFRIEQKAERGKKLCFKHSHCCFFLLVASAYTEKFVASVAAAYTYAVSFENVMLLF